MSIRQRRRNRHRVKAVHRLQAPRPYITLNIDVSKINEAIAQVKKQMSRLALVIAQPEFQTMVSQSCQKIADGLSPQVIRGMISVQRTVQDSDIFVDEDACLGDPSCKFNARSPEARLAVAALQLRRRQSRQQKN